MTFTWILMGCSVVLLTLTLTPLSRRKEWWIRAWEFPRVQLAIGCLLLFAASLFQLAPGRWITWLPAAVGLGCFLWQAIRIYPFTPLWRVEVPRVKAPGEKQTLTFIVSNVLMDNRKTAPLLELVRRENPDMVLTLEGDAYWGEHLAQLKSDYPHSIERPRDDTYGMHLFSRLPLVKSEVRHLVMEYAPSFSAVLEMPDGRHVQLFCLHPSPPSPTEHETSKERDAELVMVGHEAAECSLPIIVAGDLNDVAWSRTTRRFRLISGLLDPRVGRGFFNTFHAGIPLVRWPLDHVFLSPHFRLVRMERLPYIGSDHFPILVELELEPHAPDSPAEPLPE